MSERKLAHIERIEEIIPIEGADRIVQYRVLGWHVISKKDEFKVGDLVVFIEPDAWVSNELAPFLTKPDKFPKVYNGISGERLKTIRLKKALSQGLLLPVAGFDKLEITIDEHSYYFSDVAWNEGEDVTEALGIIKWEPEPEKIPVNAKGNYPSFIPKTDQERVQNFMRSIENALEKDPTLRFTKEEKAEGSSTTHFLYHGEFGSCSRNLQLKIDDPEIFETSQWTKPIAKIGLREKMIELGRHIAIQGETVGPAIQNNIHGLTDWEFRVFDIFDIDKQEYLMPGEMHALAEFLGLQTVPVLCTNFDITGMTVGDFLKDAHGTTQIGPSKHLREGVVYKAQTGSRFTFKSVCPEYLLLRGY